MHELISSPQYRLLSCNPGSLSLHTINTIISQLFYCQSVVRGWGVVRNVICNQTPNQHTKGFEIKIIIKQNFTNPQLPIVWVSEPPIDVLNVKKNNNKRVCYAKEQTLASVDKVDISHIRCRVRAYACTKCDIFIFPKINKDQRFQRIKSFLTRCAI